ncbi:helix-turn-helix transcriptional regulator [Streptomyces alkaliterrae]|nr:LuxR family transcriptional regulator [Streptomyces alkaliterrae]
MSASVWPPRDPGGGGRHARTRAGVVESAATAQVGWPDRTPSDLAADVPETPTDVPDVPDEGAASADRMERALLQARELIDSTMSLHRDRPARDALVIRADDAEAGATVARLLGRARHSISASLPGDGEQSQTVFAALTGRRPEPTGRTAGPLAAGSSRGADRVVVQASRRARTPEAGGVVVRLLCTPRALSAGVPSAAALRAARCEIRVVDSELREALIVDGRVALIQSGPEHSDSAAIIKDTASVRALDLLFAGSWANARPLAEHLRLSERLLRTPSAQRVLERLREGHTDDVAARELQVSLRTYRRYVAAVMKELGVSSRFQAGVRAVELGLLPRRGTVAGAGLSGVGRA